LFEFSFLLNESVHWQLKEETILKISEEWSILKPMIKKHLESDTLGERTKHEMHEILFNMKQYKKYHSKIFHRNGVQAKTNIQDNHKKSKSTKTQTKETRDEISRHKHSYSPERTRDKKSRRKQRGFALQLYSPKRHRQKENKKRHPKRDSDTDSDSSDSSSSSDGGLPDRFSRFRD
jgi:superfamily I DNA and RNA helicase